MDTFPLALHYDAHHLLVGVVVPERMPATLWHLRGGLGFQGTRPTLVPPHRQVVHVTHGLALILALSAPAADALEAHARQAKPGQALVNEEAVALVLGPHQAEALDTLNRRWGRGDLAVLPSLGADPAVWAIASRVRPQVRALLLDQQRAARRLAKAAALTGIEAELRAAHLPVHRLTPVWDDPIREKGLAFRLEPTDPQQAQPGVYRASELRAWITGEGPVVPDQALRAEEAHHEGASLNLLARLNQAGVVILRHRATWVGQGRHQVLGYHVVPAPGHETVLPEGAYSWRFLQGRFPLPPAPPVSPALHDLRHHLRRLRR